MRIDKLVTFLLLLIVSNAFGQCGETGYFHLNYHGIIDEFETDNSNHVIAAVRIQNSTTLVKTDDARNILQELDMGDINSWAQVRDITIDSEDNIYICGTFQANIYFGPGYSYAGPGGFVAKLNTDFQVQWVKLSQNAYPKAITIDSNNGLYVGFSAGPTFIFQGQTYSAPASGYYVCLFKLNASNGVPQWNKKQRYDGSVFEAVYRLETSDEFGVYEVVNFDEFFLDEFGVYYEGTNEGGYHELNSMICYYDSQGNRAWIKQMFHGEPMATGKTFNGNVALYCDMDEYLSVGTDSIYSYYRKSSGYVEYNPSGDLIRMERIVSSLLPNDMSSDICGIDCLPDGGFIVSGRSQRNVNFNGLVDSANYASGYHPYFIARYDSICTPVWAHTFGEGDSLSGMTDVGIRIMNDCSVYFAGDAWEKFRYDANNGDTIPMTRILFLLEFDLETGVLATDSTLHGGGNSTDDPFGPNGVGLDELSHENLAVFPNPVSTVLTLKTKGTDLFKWEIHNEMGQKLIEGEAYGSSEIDMSNLPSGLYVMKISNDQNALTKKISKY
ncbi:T9SS type A sorting domain-containing protein [Fluviicola sp.]|uniref:T9SS type A sorting domain-containing protein n=1 Tax=Fluviicola sp. TaxID=1917219 RepID=UPI0031E20E21